MSHQTRDAQSAELQSLAEQQHPTDQYATLHSTAEELARSMRDDVIETLAKHAFEEDCGIPVTQVLPDRTENYDFEHGPFEALLLPDERRCVNHTFDSRAITAETVMSDPDWFRECVEQGEAVWEETFGEFKRYVTQSGHPGAFPMDGEETRTLLTYLDVLYESVTRAKSLDVVIESARNRNFVLLSELFGTSREEILTPGGTDLAVIPRADELHVPFNDGEIAVIRPTTDTATAAQDTPTRGLVIGHDDTPVGIFAHVIDVTNLAPDQQLNRAIIRDSMGFDRELDPWAEIEELHPEPGERIRLQGDLRVERTDDVDGFADELARRTRISEYRDVISDALTDVSLPSQYVWGRRGDVPITAALDVTVSPDGNVTIDPLTDDLQVELLAYATLVKELASGPAAQYAEYSDIPYIVEPRMTRRSLAHGSTAEALEQGYADAVETLETIVAAKQRSVESEARDVAAEATVGMDVPRQVNLPVDNHMTFVQAGYAPDVETEPVPVAVPEETTLHIEHGEHNTVTVQIPTGVYRFSLLPRGLQPQDERPQWPEPSTDDC